MLPNIILNLITMIFKNPISTEENLEKEALSSVIENTTVKLIPTALAKRFIETAMKFPPELQNQISLKNPQEMGVF